MPADADTVTAIHDATQALGDRIEKKITAVERKGEDQTRRIHERFDRHEQAETELFRQFTGTLSGIQSEIQMHSEEIREGKNDRKGIWKWIIGVATGAGAGSGLIAKWFGGGGST